MTTGDAVDGTSTAAGATTGDEGTTLPTSATTDPASSSSGGFKFDLGSTEDQDTGRPGDVCKVNDDMDAVGTCRDQAPPNSFEPDVQWSWAGEGVDTQIIETPVVVNLTDDNGDGEIDLCDIPDVVVAAYQSYSAGGHLYVIDGATGTVHFQIPDAINPLATPAVGDIDGDGIPEIVTAVYENMLTSENRLVAFEHDGTLKWTSNVAFGSSWQHSVALYDLDADGDVEILYGDQVFDHDGQQVLDLPAAPGAIQITIAADLDGDDDLEIIMGSDAFHHDGTPYYTVGLGPTHPQVADLDEDGLPEVLLVSYTGISMLEHDGTPVYTNQAPNGGTSWWRPAAIHDVDGDAVAEIVVSANNNYSAYEADLSTLWTATVQDGSGYAAGTAFDFLGSGTAQAMYADETTLFIYDGQGQILLQSPRSSWTESENPVVADIDNDGSAEILVVSNGGQAALQAIRDVQDRWIQARRVWNQHAYHVTNVREDGTIPQFMPRNWELLNTFRTQAQIEGGTICDPAR